MTVNSSKKRSNKKSGVSSSATEIQSQIESESLANPGDSLPIVVVGDGWASLATVGFLAASGVQVRWIEGSGTQMVPPLSCMDSGIALEICSELGRQLGVELGEYRPGSFIREFRNKSFRQPPWMKAPDPQARLEVRDEVLWAPETKIANVLSAKFNIPFIEVEERFRAALGSSRFRNLQRIEGIPLGGIEASKNEEGEDIWTVTLANGQLIRCRQIIYADRWSLLRKLEGFPKGQKFIQRRDPVGALQALFEHQLPVGIGVEESFYASLHKENGEEIERNLWGYFSSDGMRSFWTLCLAEDEVENNHEIAKKFRRLKSTLDKIFTGDVFIPKPVESTSLSENAANFAAHLGREQIGEVENTAKLTAHLAGEQVRPVAHPPKFTANLAGEQVRLVEDAIFAAGETVLEPITVPALQGVVFLTDGYGPAAALQQVDALLGVLATAAQLATQLKDGVEGLITESSDLMSESADLHLESAELNKESAGLNAESLVRNTQSADWNAESAERTAHLAERNTEATESF